MTKADVLARWRIQKSVGNPEVVGLLVPQDPRRQGIPRRPDLDPGIKAGFAVLLAIALNCGECRQIPVLAKVEPEPDRLARLGFELRQQRLERRARHPGGFGIGPHTEVQPQNPVQLPRDGLRLCHDFREVLLRDRDAQQRVRLDPATRIGQRIVALVEPADIAERRVVDDLAQERRVGHRIRIASRHPDRVFVFLPCDRIAVRARVGDHEQQWIAAELEAALQHLDDRAIRKLVNLVRQHKIRPRARAGLTGIARHRTKEAARGQMRDVELAPGTAREL